MYLIFFVYVFLSFGAENPGSIQGNLGTARVCSCQAMGLLLISEICKFVLVFRSLTFSHTSMCNEPSTFTSNGDPSSIFCHSDLSSTFCHSDPSSALCKSDLSFTFYDSDPSSPFCNSEPSCNGNNEPSISISNDGPSSTFCTCEPSSNGSHKPSAFIASNLFPACSDDLRPSVCKRPASTKI